LGRQPKHGGQGLGPRREGNVSWPAWREVRSTAITALFFIFVVATHVYVVDRIWLRLIDQMVPTATLESGSQSAIGETGQVQFALGGTILLFLLHKSQNNLRFRISYNNITDSEQVRRFAQDSQTAPLPAGSPLLYGSLCNMVAVLRTLACCERMLSETL